MAPFRFRIEALSHHSVWGLEAVKTGVFAPPALIGAMPFAGLRALVDEAIAALEALTPAEVNGWAGKALNIALYRPLDEDDRSSAWAPRQLAFTSETFLLSLSLPNFHFHAVTAYDILRSRGVPLGKRDYEGQLRTRSTSPKSDSATHGEGRFSQLTSAMFTNDLDFTVDTEIGISILSAKNPSFAFHAVPQDSHAVAPSLICFWREGGYRS